MSPETSNFAAQIALSIGNFIFLFLGIVHFLLTFWTDKLNAKNSELNTAMQQSTLVITKETSMWKAWLGFNASHSFGAIYFGSINIYLIIFNFDFFKNSLILISLNLLFAYAFLILAKKFWFSSPVRGISLGCLFISIGYLLLI